MQDLGQFVGNNWELFVALFIILFLLARTWIGPGSVNHVVPNEAIQLINHKNALVVDVRTDKEYQQGHVMNSLHIPLGLLDDRLHELKGYKNSAVVMICRSGARSGHAAAKLKKQGFTDVHNLAGGIMAWERANLPVTTKGGKPPKPASSETTDTVVETTVDDKPVDEKHRVVVYTTRKCPFCTRAIDLLNAKNIGFKEIRIDEETDKRDEMESRAGGQTSVPQIFIGDVHVGGCDDMYALEDKGELDALLGLKDSSESENKPQDAIA